MTPRVEPLSPRDLDAAVPALRLLVAIADEGGLSAGARAIGMAQSNASRALAGLEARLGIGLVTRRTSGSTLTPPGALTVEWARDVIDALDRLATGAAALRGTGGELVVGASMTIAEYLAPGWLATLRRGDPDVAVSLQIDNSAAVIDAVRHGRLALGFVETPNIPADLARHRIGSDRLVVVISPEHPWAERRGGVPLAELAATPLVEREPGSGTRAFLDAAVASALPGARRARPIAELTSNAAIVASVAAGLGPAALSGHAVRGALRDGLLLAVPATGGDIGRELHAVWRGASGPVGASARLVALAETSLRADGAG